ncbi:hypothetical protein SAMN04488500_1363 [Sporomusa malonica]|uniref:Uncharacterized protein n=1 Tax=Sporomusa malonica TaxID=112901 RepID=A0A1W2EZ08_9FIRM|nr:hypothetical protein SAMN04488500_1363 [Sporomusa malonica]
MNEAMLKEIITRILSSPELQTLLTQSTPGQGAKPGCLIVLNHQDGVRQLPELAQRYSQDYSLEVCIIGPVELAANKINRVTYEQAIKQSHWARLQIPVCTPDQLAQIALGLSADPTTKLVAWAIATGIPVEIGQVQWGFTAKTPEKYRQLFAGYLRQVAEFGVLMHGNCTAGPQPAGLTSQPAAPHNSQALQTIPAPYSSQQPPETQPQQPAGVTYEKRLLSNKEALRLSGVVRLSKTTVITPGAIDVLKQQKVEVYREGVRFL